MGRKRIDIKFIEDRKVRKSTFNTRIGGIIKKLYDLAILCGVKVSLVVTNTEDDIVAYSNSNSIQLLVSDQFNNHKNDFSVSVFRDDDVSPLSLNFYILNSRTLL